MSKTNHRAFLDFFYNYYSKTMGHDISLAYEGEINQQLMKAFTGQVTGRMDRESEDPVLQKKVYHVMIECLQNITKHALEEGELTLRDQEKGLLMVTRSKKEYHIVTGNYIEQKRIPALNNLLEKVNNLDPDDLDDLHRKKLKQGKISSKGGAGLGFIDIKRKTGRNLEYHFLPVNKTLAFFTLVSIIPKIQKN